MTQYSEYKYCELVTGNIKNRNSIVLASEIRQILQQNGSVECYRSHYRFTQDYQDYVKRTGSVSNYDGPGYVDFLWLDIDDRDDLSVALSKAQTLINRLQHSYEIPPSYLRCFFSGKKGFHIGIPAEIFGLEPSKDISAICKGLANQIAGDIGIDDSVYGHVKIFRLNNTKHGSSGNYKIELEPTEITLCTDVNEIVELASAPRQLNRVYDPQDAYGDLAHLVKRPQPAQKSTEVDKPDAPSENWITGLLEGGAGQGSRTEAVTRLAGYFCKQGYALDIATGIISAWDLARNDPPLSGDKDYAPDKVEATVAGIYQRYSQERATEQPESEIRYHTWRTSHERAPAYIEKFNQTRIQFGFPLIDRNSSGLGLGETAIILAYVGVGKTALAQTIQINVAEEQKIPSLLFSLEMSSMRLYFRHLAMVWGDHPRNIERTIAAGNGDQLTSGLDKYDSMMTVDYAPMSVPLMKDIIKTAPQPPGLVIVDYVGLLSEESNTPYERMTKLSRSLAVMAKELDIALICIYQTNRTGHGGEVSLAMARDSGMIEANCDIALGLWPVETMPNERVLKLLKARHGQAGTSHTLAFFGNSPRLFVSDRRELEDDNPDSI